MFIPGIRPRHVSSSAPTHSPNGPWLPHGLYCPSGSSLTMAISEPLHASSRFSVYVRLALRKAPACTGSPIYSASPLATCRHQYSGGSSRCSYRCLPCRCCLRSTPTSSTATGVLGNPEPPRMSSRSCNVRLMLRPATLLAPLWSGLLHPSFRQSSHLESRVGYD